LRSSDTVGDPNPMLVDRQPTEVRRDEIDVLMPV
jgi:hypothetical protein